MIITARPYSTNWSGNGIWYAFFSDAALADPTVTIEVRLRFKRLDAQVFSEGVAIPLIPWQGKAAINIQTLVDAELEYGLPSLLNPSDITSCATQTGQFYIEFREIIAGNNDPAWDGSEAQLLRNAVKGGVPEFDFNNNGYWNHYYFTSLPFLTWQLNGRLAAYGERIYLAWYQAYSLVNADLRVVYTITYTDLNLPSAKYMLPFGRAPLNVHYLPAGAGMVDLNAVTPGKTIWKYTVQVVNFVDPNNPAPASEVFLFEIDNRPNYNEEYLIYRSSPGGLDTVRIRGIIEKDADYTLQQTGQVQKPYYDQGNKPTPTLYQLPAQEVVTYKGDIGHLKKEEQDRLSDIFLQRELYFVKSRRWLSLNLTIKSLTKRKSNDKVWSLPIEYSLANEGNKFYAPPAADFGDDYADKNTCDARIENIIATRQLINGGTICEVTFTFNVAGTLVGKVQYSSSNQNIGGIPHLNIQQWNDLAYPYVNPLVLRFPANTLVTVYFKAICNNGMGGLVNSIDIDTSASDAGGGGGGGGTGAPNNSRIINQSSHDVVATVRINGNVVLQKNVKHKTGLTLFNYELFTAPDLNNATVQVELGNSIPTGGTLDTNGLVYNGVVDPNGILVFYGVNIVNGIVIAFS